MEKENNSHFPSLGFWVAIPAVTGMIIATIERSIATNYLEFFYIITIFFLLWLLFEIYRKTRLGAIVGLVLMPVVYQFLASWLGTYILKYDTFMLSGSINNDLYTDWNTSYLYMVLSIVIYFVYSRDYLNNAGRKYKIRFLIGLVIAGVLLLRLIPETIAFIILSFGGNSLFSAPPGVAFIYTCITGVIIFFFYVMLSKLKKRQDQNISVSRTQGQSPTKISFLKMFYVTVVITVSGFIFLNFLGGNLMTPKTGKLLNITKPQHKEEVYNFSKPILLSQDISHAGSTDLQIQGNTVLWSPSNSNKLSLFQFNPQNNTGFNQEIDGDSTIIDNKIYWVDPAKDALFQYEPISQKTELLFSGLKGKFFRGKYKDNIILLDENGRSTFYVYNLISKETSIIDEISPTLDFVLKDEYLCYIAEDRDIKRYNIATKQNEVMVRNPFSQNGLLPGKSHITSCGSIYLTYINDLDNDGRDVCVYDAIRHKVILTKSISPGKDVIGLGGKTDGDYLYYKEGIPSPLFMSDYETVVQGKIIAVNLKTGEERLVLSREKNLSYWDVSGDFIIYAVANQENAYSLYLERINPSSLSR